MLPLRDLILWLPTFLLALAIHEWAHAYAAVRLGDPTPRLQGRLTLNPAAHLSLLGTLIFLVAGVGWAKPVQVNARNLKNPDWDMLWIALAGPASNLVQAIAYSILIHLFVPFTGLRSPIIELFLGGFQINIFLAVFNLLPVPPLDGWKIARPFLPRRWSYTVDGLEPIGFLVVLALFRLGVLGPVLNWAYWTAARVLL